MDDLEICKAIAAIEGVEYDPLADDGLCFRMMIKHEIEMYKIDDYYYCEWVGSNTTVNNKKPRKALCLAIIAKRGGINNDNITINDQQDRKQDRKS